MNKAFLFFSLVFFVSQQAWSQTTKTVVRANAYFTIPIPGTIMADDNGNPLQPQRQKVYTVFVETKGTMPVWTKAWSHDKYFTTTAIPVNGNSVLVGKQKATGRKIVLKATKGNVLQQLEFAPASTHQRPPCTVGVNEILLEGKLKGKTFYHKISGLTELASPEYQ